MWFETALCKVLGLAFPIIQAPMAGGVTTPELIAAVSNSGGLGSLGAGYMTGEDIRLSIQKIRALTTKPFAINLFIPEAHHASHEEVLRSCAVIERACRELNIKLSPIGPPFLPSFEEQIRVVCEEKVPVFSFTFGILDEHWITTLQNNGTKLIGTATHLAEARLLENSNVDIVIVQGSEAGGHRGTFIGPAEDALINLANLLPQVVNAIKVPVVAAGGIMDAKGVVAAFADGAVGVQMGTAFLTCFESDIPFSYKKTLLQAKKDNTSLSAAFSGKLARGIRNLFMERLSEHQDAILDYPIQNTLTRSMRREAEKQNNPDFMSLYAGVGVALSKEQSAADIMSELIQNTTVLMAK